MRKYDHLEKWGHDEVDGIDIGKCYVFPKLDGTNGRVWLESGELMFGSRNRVLSPEDDNQGFLDAHCEDAELADSLATIEGARGSQVVLYGEWMIPHTLKTYRPEVWRRFFVFDVFDISANRYLAWDEYSSYLEGLSLIEPLAIVDNPVEQQLLGLLATNTYLIQDGLGAGEGIVVKNYEWKNKYGRQPWAKLVRTEFKEKNARAMGTRVMGERAQVEAAIAEEAVTLALVAKERAKIGDVDKCQLIPRLLQTVFYCVVKEELWDLVKKHKFPSVDFKRLRQFCERETKLHAPDLFGGAS